MNAGGPERGRGYAIATLAVAAAAGLRAAVDPFLGDAIPFATFYLAVLVSAWFGGVAPALLATLLGYAVGNWFFLPPRGSFTIGGPGAVAVTAALYLAVGVGIAVIGGSMRSARRLAEERAAEAEERRRALEAMHTRERQLARAVDAVRMGTWDVDLGTGRVTDSARMSELLGHDPVPAVRSLDERRGFLHPEDVERECQALESAIREGADYEVEYRTVGADGRVRWIESAGRVVRDASGALHAVGAAWDVSDRRLAEETRARLAAIVESSDDAIVAKDLHGTITDWNAAAARMFGWTRADVLGRSTLILVPPDRHDEERRILEALRRGERIEHFETERLHRDGTRVQVSISLSPITDASGGVIGAANITRDIGARKSNEAERERALAQERAARAEAEAANRAKDVFLATVSHELRTPLSPILAWARMLREGKLDDEKSRQALLTIERNAHSQARLIEDLLDVSRIVSGKLRLQVRPVALAPIVEAAVEVVRTAAEAKGIRLQAVLDPDTGSVAGDPDRLQQVVWNLLSNAVKFTAKGGRVQVMLERVNSHVEIAVSDTGQGIGPEFLPYIFERFRQEDTSFTRKHGGLGLGLAIVRHLVELHGGTVHAESPGEDRGTTFTVKLPLLVFARVAGEQERRHPAAAPGAADHRYPSLGGVRVLVVDDEPDSNEVVGTLLASCGAEVRVAGAVGQALDTVDGWKPDVIVTDIGMPEEDGFALLARLRARGGEEATTPVVALTAYATSEDRVRLLSAGFSMHVAKPVDPAELVAVVSNVSRTARSP